MKVAEQSRDKTTRCSPGSTGETIDMAALLGREKFEDFLRQLEVQLRDFLVLLSEQPINVAAIRVQAHALVASAGMLGFHVLSEGCVSLENSSSAQSIKQAQEVCAAALTEISTKCTAREKA